LHTIRPEYVLGIIKHANSLRNSCADQEMQADYIVVSPEW